MRGHPEGPADRARWSQAQELRVCGYARSVAPIAHTSGRLPRSETRKGVHMEDAEIQVTGPDDMYCIAGYADLDAFVDHVQNQTDLEVELIVEDDYVCVMHESGGSQPGQMTFEYPFDPEDIAHWVYHFENDNSIRYEILEDVENMLDLPVYADDTEDEEYERTERVREFVTGLLWERWIDLDGSDLLIMDPDGGPLALTCSHEWLTYCLGNVLRPYRPTAGRPTVAKLYSDGRLALAWPEEEDELADQDGIERPLPDLLVVDLAIAEDPLSLYDTAYAAFWSTFGE